MRTPGAEVRRAGSGLSDARNDREAPEDLAGACFFSSFFSAVLFSSPSSTGTAATTAAAVCTITGVGLSWTAAGGTGGTWVVDGVVDGGGV